MKKLRMALVGCGAVADVHMPLIQSSERAEAALLVDKSLERARQVGERYGVDALAEDYKEIVGKADAAILALPHHLHAPVACDLLRRGVHVLVEKPMAMTEAECDDMIQAAEEGKALLGVGMGSRFFVTMELVQRLVQAGALGEIQSFHVREGFEYAWPVASDFMFRREAGGGVLFDTGAHLLDTLLWILGDFETVEYFDDSEGGVEADCELRLRMKSGAVGTVEMSRTRNLGNSWTLVGELGTLHFGRQFNSGFKLEVPGQDLYLNADCLRGPTRPEDPDECFRRQLESFLDSALDGRPLAVDGREGRRVVSLIERCHASRQPLELPW